MEKWMQHMFQLCGKHARLVGRAGEKPVQVLLKGDRTGAHSRVFSPLGELPQGNQVCYFPGETPVAPGDALVLETGKFRICRAESYGIGGRRPLYIRALCAPMGEEDTWGL